MLALRDGLTLYHGSYVAISKIDLEKCSPGRDFGQGFYLTSSYEQARNFVPPSIKSTGPKTLPIALASVSSRPTG